MFSNGHLQAFDLFLCHVGRQMDIDMGVFVVVHGIFREISWSILKSCSLLGVLTPREHIPEFREPDILLVCAADDPRRQHRFWLGADLVVEIVSPDKPERDLIEKRNDYAETQIPEYWIVDPRDETITVLRLEGDAYVEHGSITRDLQATSVLLDGFTIQVNAVFDAT